MGKIHPKYATPHAALIVQFVVSALLVVINFAGGWVWNQFASLGLVRSAWGILGMDSAKLIATPQGVQETFQRLLSLAVVLQLVPFLYMFAALVKFGWNSDDSGHYGRGTLLLSGACGFVTTCLGIALVFFPAQQITSLVSYEIWMFGGTTFFVALAAFFFFVYGRKKMQRVGIHEAAGVLARPVERSSTD